MIGISFGFLVPDAEGLLACHWPGNEEADEQQKGEAAEDGSDAAKHRSWKIRASTTESRIIKLR